MDFIAYQQEGKVIKGERDIRTSTKRDTTALCHAQGEIFWK